jgi:Sec-independent protein translocase protein TatA
VFFLSPVKLLVILVVALAVLGPDTLPKVAKQIGGFWGEFKRFRQKLESEVRGSFPDLPSTETITQAVRSPLSFLDTLADGHAPESGATTTAEQRAEPEPEPVYTLGPLAVTSESDHPPAVVRAPIPVAHHRLAPTPGGSDDPGLN